MIEEFYKKIKGNYQEAICRMRDNERIKKYLKLFLGDESFENLEKSIETNNCEEAFKSAHTLKGVIQNMAFTDLSKIVAELTELLRNGNLIEAKKLFPIVSKKYKIIIDEINKVL